MKTGTLSEYAAHAAVSPAYVTKLKKQGRLVMVEHDGREVVNFDATDRLVRNTADLGRAGNGRNAGGGSATMSALASDGGGSGQGPGGFDVLFRKAQTQERVFSAKRAEVEYQQLVGELVPRADSIKAAKEIGRQVRDALSASRRRLSPDLAACQSVTECEEIQRREHQVLLDNLTKELARLYYTESLQA